MERAPACGALRALARLKGELPPQLPLSGVRLSAVDRGVVVHDGPLRWEAESGQLLLELDRPEEGNTITVIMEGVAKEYCG